MNVCFATGGFVGAGMLAIGIGVEVSATIALAIALGAATTGADASASAIGSAVAVVRSPPHPNNTAVAATQSAFDGTVESGRTARDVRSAGRGPFFTTALTP